MLTTSKIHSLVLADDHQLIRHALRRMIEEDGGYRIVGEASDGREVMELTLGKSPDLVVMDIGMPGLNGIDACRQIRRASPRTRVVAVSAYTDRRRVNDMLDAGAVGYVAKGSAADELLRALASVVAGRKYLSPEVTDAVVNHVTGNDDGEADPLGPREREVLQLLAEGHTSGEIASDLHIATSTVETHRRNLMRKLGIHSVAELTKYAVREGLTTLE